MVDVLLTVADEHKGKSKEELLVIFEREVDKFSSYMKTVSGFGGGPLNKMERQLVLTYLVQKYTGKVDQPTTPPASPVEQP